MASIFQDIVASCSQCTVSFNLRNRAQLAAINRGNAVFCSDTCRNRFYYARDEIRKAFQQGPCPTCHRMFSSKRKKTYCSLECYIASPATKERLQALAASQRIWNHCPQCNEIVQKRKTKFCNKLCRRLYFAERFDRWVASPETLALPQNYDEFLTQAVLPCLVAGCDWEGQSLSQHCNVVHGIDVHQLRELGGFNRKTGLCTPAVSAARSEVAKRLMAEGVIGAYQWTEAPAQQARVGLRLEAGEHRRKAQALIRAAAVLPPPQPCRQCGTDVVQTSVTPTLYCSTKCRTAYYAQQGKAELRCAYCNQVFLGNRAQVKSAQKGNKVCCCHDHRNKMNMATCLAKRQQREKKQNE